MKKSLVKGVALLAASAFGFVGVSLTPANADTTKTSVTIFETSALSSLNPGTPATNLVTNTDVTYPTGIGFAYYDDKAALIRNTAFGTFKISKNVPGDFEVTYTVKKGLKWSDGTLITGQDLLLSHILGSSDYSLKAGLGDTSLSPAFNSGGYGSPYDNHTSASSVSLSDDNYSVTVKYDAYQPDWQILGPGPSPVHALVGLAKGKKALQDARTNAAYKQVFEDAFFNAIDTSSNFSGISATGPAGTSAIVVSHADAVRLDLGDKVFGTGLQKSGSTISDIEPSLAGVSTAADVAAGASSFKVDDASTWFKGMKVSVDGDTVAANARTVSSVNYDTNVVSISGTFPAAISSADDTISATGTGVIVLADDNIGTVNGNLTSKGASWLSAQALLKVMGQKWSNSYNITTVNSSTNPLLLISNGGYKISSCVDNVSCTLVRNPLYNDGPKITGNIDTIVYKYGSDETGVPLLLKNGEIDIYDGQPTTDAYAELKSYSSKVNTSTTSTMTYEHIDLRVGTSSTWPDKYTGSCPSTYTGPFAGNSQKAKDLRTAFLLTVPRQAIANLEIAQLFNPASTENSAVLNSQFLLPVAKAYAGVVKNSGINNFVDTTPALRAANTAKALELVKKYYPSASATNSVVDVKMLFKNNARRIGENGLIATEAKKAGFNVSRTGNSAWSTQLNCNTYDVAMFAWAPSSVSQTGTNANFQSDGSNNHYGWNDAAVDTQTHALEGSLTDAQLSAAYLAAEKAIYANAWSLPLYQWPGVIAYNNQLKNIKPSPLVPNVVWNYWSWSY
jgi:ABC-type transport system substrate-binding protein